MEQQPFDVFSANCPSRAAWEHVTGRWGALVLGALADGPLRFGALRRAVGGVSDRMLSQTLQALERDGLVHREDHGTNPPHVEYSVDAGGPAGGRQRRGARGDDPPGHADGDVGAGRRLRI